MTVREHESDAVAHISKSIRSLEVARDAAEHGNYDGAAQFVAEARMWLRDAELELLRAATGDSR